MIRFISAVTFISLFLICSIPIFFVEWIIGKFNMDLKNRSSLRIVQWAIRTATWFCGTDVTYIGLENIPKDKALLFVANHRSIFDIVLTYQKMVGPNGYISKKEMYKVPLMSTWMRLLHCQFLDRDDVKAGLKTILASIESIKKGISIFIFPEGTRSKEPDAFLPFHSGSFKIVQKAKCPIVPVTLNNTNTIFEDQFPKVKKVHVVIEFGTPIHVEELAPEDQKDLAGYCPKLFRKLISRTKHWYSCFFKQQRITP